MKYRRLDPSGDMVFGGGLRAFHVNAPAGVAQAVKTRLGMYLGEWFLDTSAGTPWNTQVLGKYTASTRDVVLRGRILGTTGLRSIVALSSQTNRDERSYAMQATIDTAYGRATVSAGPL